jgi:hypothetical protein
MILSGCNETSNNASDTFKVYIENDKDDGYIAREESLVGGKITTEDNEPMIVGLFSDPQDGVNYLSRGILRFDISDWDNSDITFFIKCINVEGSPNQLEAYFMDDPETLIDFSSVWPLTDTSIKFFGEAFPTENTWVKITVQKDFIDDIVNEKYSRNEYMTILLVQFLDFSLDEYNNYYEFATVDYSPNDNNDQPYIEFS